MIQPGHDPVLTAPQQPLCYFDLSLAPPGRQPDMQLSSRRVATRLRAALASIHEQEYLLAAHAQAEADLMRDLERTVVTVRVQVQSALNYMERGSLDAAAVVLAELNTAMAEGALRRTPAFFAYGSHAADFLLTIRQYVTHFAELHELALALDFDPALSADHLPQAVRLPMVRVLQSLLDNVASHAQAQQLAVQLGHIPTGVILTVRDDGVGFDPLVILPGRADAGFALIQERLDLLHGSLTIAAAPGAGVEVRALFPCAPVLAVLRGRRVLLAIEHSLTREGVRAMLIEQGMAVDAVAACHDLFLTSPPATPPDLVLFDIDLSGAVAVAAIRQVRAVWPNARVVVLLEEGYPDLPALLRNDADGYVLKTLPTAAFFEALERIINGEALVAPGLATEVLTAFRRQTNESSKPPVLTSRQLETLQLIGRGLAYAEIAAQLHISERTVRYHTEQLRRQLGLANRSQLASYARRHPPFDPA